MDSRGVGVVVTVVAVDDVGVTDGVTDGDDIGVVTRVAVVVDTSVGGAGNGKVGVVRVDDCVGVVGRTPD